MPAAAVVKYATLVLARAKAHFTAPPKVRIAAPAATTVAATAAIMTATSVIMGCSAAKPEMALFSDLMFAMTETIARSTTEKASANPSFTRMLPAS